LNEPCVDIARFLGLFFVFTEITFMPFKSNKATVCNLVAPATTFNTPLVIGLG
jgi:hypothetical protein